MSVSKKPTRRTRVHVKVEGDEERKARAEQIIQDSFEWTEEHREKAEKKRQARKKPFYGYTGENWAKDPKWSDPESPFGVKMNKPGLVHLYEVHFERKFNISVSMYTKGKPNKKAYVLHSILEDYDIEVVMSAVLYAIDNWEEIQSLTRIAKPATVDAIWGLRHELCYPITQDEDPLVSLKKVKGYKSKREKQNQKDQFKKKETDQKVGWGSFE